MLDAMRFWLDRGVDGFRVDVIWLMIKDDLFRDEPQDPNWDGIKGHHRCCTSTPATGLRCTS